MRRAAHFAAGRTPALCHSYQVRFPPIAENLRHVPCSADSPGMAFHIGLNIETICDLCVQALLGSLAFA